MRTTGWKYTPQKNGIFKYFFSQSKKKTDQGRAERKMKGNERKMKEDERKMKGNERKM